MVADAKLAPPLAASAVLHGLLLAAGLLSAVPTRHQEPRDAWAAHTVEVGTLPEPAGARAAPSEPAPATEAAAPKPDPVAPVEPAREQRDAAVAPVERARERREAAVDAPRARPPASARKAPAAESAPREAASSAPAGTEGGGSLGSVGLPPGVRHLATAFTRALPAGSFRDSAWAELPLGRVGEVTVSLHVSDTGKLEEIEVSREGDVPGVLTRMVERAKLLLRSGTFSLDPAKVRAGVEHLRVEVSLSERSPHPDEDAAPEQLFAQGYRAPTAREPGYARFTLNSGRHMEAVVSLVEEPR